MAVPVPEIPAIRPTSRWRSAINWQILALCLAAVVLSGRSIRDEGAVSVQGDMAQYLMDGAFIHDLVRDAPVSDVLGYTYRYYARYPALSLGHHPLLLPVAEAPLFAVAGISVFSGRLTIILFLVLGVVLWFKLVASRFDEVTAVLSSLLLVTTPAIVTHSQAVLSEIPTLALIIAALFFLERFRRRQTRLDLVGFAGCVVLSIYAKQVAVLMLPLYAGYVAWSFGLRGLLSKRMFGVGAAIVLLISPLVPLTLWLSPYNVAVILKGAPPVLSATRPDVTPAQGSSVESPVIPVPVPSSAAEPTPTGFLDSLTRYMRHLRHQLTLPLLVLALIATASGIARRDPLVLFPLVWIILFLVELSALAYVISRLVIYTIPPICLLAATLARAATRPVRVVAVGVVLAGVVYQTTLAARIAPDGARGYEEAARFVLDHAPGDAVLFSGATDTAYFAFFVRKHDADRRLVVLRADKILTTSRMEIPNVKDRIGRPEQIRALLRAYGVRYVVVEDAVYPPGPLRWLQQEVQTEGFSLVQRIPLQSQSPRLVHASVGVYEFLAHTRADEAVSLDLDIPLIGRSITVPMRDLIRPGLSR
jgi:4-amino-4-deoxy-L-arabinose transferase-like glycosyltransferase